MEVAATSPVYLILVSHGTFMDYLINTLLHGANSCHKNAPEPLGRTWGSFWKTWCPAMRCKGTGEPSSVMRNEEQEAEALTLAELNNVVYAHSNTAVSHLQVSDCGAVRIHELNSQPKCEAMSYFELFPN